MLSEDEVLEAANGAQVFINLRFLGESDRQTKYFNENYYFQAFLLINFVN